MEACHWLVEIYNPDGEVVVVECGAEVTRRDDGWDCTAGHHHNNYGSKAWAEDEAYEAWEEGGRAW